MSHRINFSPEAYSDLSEIYNYIAYRTDHDCAIGYINRIEEFCDKLSDFPERGTRRDDLRPGLRALGFERRAEIAFHINGDTVTILRILYGGRDIDMMFEA